MSPAGPADPAEQRRRRAAQRAAARLHHPDLGGDAAELIRAFAEIDRSGPERPAKPTGGDRVVVARATRRGRLAGWRRTARALLPRRRRYIDIDSNTRR